MHIAFIADSVSVGPCCDEGSRTAWEELGVVGRALCSHPTDVGLLNCFVKPTTSLSCVCELFPLPTIPIVLLLRGTGCWTPKRMMHMITWLESCLV